MQFSAFPECNYFAVVLSLGCSLSVLGQSEKTTPATTAMKTVAEQVEGARVVQVQRFAESDSGSAPATRANGNMTPPQIRRHCRLQGPAEKLLKLAMEQMGLSARAHDRILRVARTIADLAGQQDIAEDHLSEAINYRALDRSYWN